MRLLLDTHILLWALSEPERLSAAQRQALVDPQNDLCVSAASLWEIDIKQSLGKLVLPDIAANWLPTHLGLLGCQVVPVDAATALRVGALPWHHRDPFDRLIVAQAQAGFILVTQDPRMGAYNVQVL